MVRVGDWLFTPVAQSWPQTLLPNTAVWSVSSNVSSLQYQVQVSWPLEWGSRGVNSTVEAMYVLDGNALGLSATESLRRRRPVEFSQPDTVTISIGYPISDSPYSPQRSIDFQPPWCNNCTPPAVPGVRSGADDFIRFIDNSLRPFVKRHVFPNVRWDRDALYGHSFGGLFVVYALLARPTLFDTFLSASPALFWNNGYILSNLSLLDTHRVPEHRKPAFLVSYGAIEQFPVKRRVETEEQFEFRREILSSMRMTDYCNALYRGLKGKRRLRDVGLHEYPFSDHASVAGAAFSDGVDYFLDWPGLVTEG